MRIRVKLGVEILPVIYRHRILALIKHALQKSSSKYLESLYTRENGKPLCKPFCYDLVIKNQDFDDEFVQLNKDTIQKISCFHFFKKSVDLIISSSDITFMLHLITGLKELRYFYFSQQDTMRINNKDVILEILDIQEEKEHLITTNEQIFKNYSGFAFTDKFDKPVRVGDPSFHEHLNRQLIRILDAYGYQLKEPIEFESIDVKNAVIKHIIGDSINNNSPILYFSGNKGIFKLKGEKEALNLLYKNGFGTRTSQGFGMVHI